MNQSLLQSQTPELRDALLLLKKEVMLDLNCHAIATVQEFDSAKQVVRATINYKKTYYQEDNTKVLVDYPILVDVPIVVMGGGKAHLTMPIAKGDECLILFNDRDMDNWFAGGGVVELSTNRLHNFSDGIALVGLNSLAKKITEYDGSRAVLRNGTASVGVSETKIQIKNQTKNLKTILETLLTALAAAQTTNAVSGQPSAFAPATITAINTAIADLGGLLE